MSEVRSFHALRREDNARRGEIPKRGHVGTHRSDSFCREADGISDGGRASVRPTRKPARYGCSYEDVRWQKLVRRIARRDARGTARRIDGAALAQGLSERRADAHGGGLEARTVRGLHDASKPGCTCGSAAGGNSGRSRHGGRRPDRRSCSSARCGRVTVSVARVNARRSSQGGRRASYPSVLEPARRCPSGDRGASEIGDVRGEGCSSRRGAGGPSLRGAERRRSSRSC